MLTPKQEEFAKKIAEGMTQADAYRFAYNTKKMTDKSIWEKASELAANVKVNERVKELRDMAAKPTIMSAQKRKERLTEIINDDEIDINAKLKAIDLLNKMDGEYVQKIAAEVQTETTINIELVDDDE
jgi:phage terminase small subunit